MAARTQVLISIRPGSDVGAVVRRLRESGAEIGEVMNEIGIVSAFIPQSRKMEIASLEGVQSVEESGEIHIPPPEAGVQ